MNELFEKYLIRYEDWFGIPLSMGQETLSYMNIGLSEKSEEYKLHYIALSYYWRTSTTIEELFEVVGLEKTDENIVEIIKHHKEWFSKDMWSKLFTSSKYTPSEMFTNLYNYHIKHNAESNL